MLIKTQSSIDLAGAATDYMHYSAYNRIGLIWFSMADKAKTSSNQHLQKGKQATCEFYVNRILPRKELYSANLLNSADDLMGSSLIMFEKRGHEKRGQCEPA